MAKYYKAYLQASSYAKKLDETSKDISEPEQMMLLEQEFKKIMSIYSESVDKQSYFLELNNSLRNELMR